MSTLGVVRLIIALIASIRILETVRPIRADATRNAANRDADGSDIGDVEVVSDEGPREDGEVDRVVVLLTRGQRPRDALVKPANAKHVIHRLGP